jgi:hypothetical protein
VNDPSAGVDGDGVATGCPEKRARTTPVREAL